MLKKILILFVFIITLVSALLIISQTRYLRKVNYYQPVKMLILSPVKMNYENFSPFGLTPGGRIFPFFNNSRNTYKHSRAFFKEIYIRTDSITLEFCYRICISIGDRSHKLSGSELMQYRMEHKLNCIAGHKTVLIKLPPFLYTSSPKIIVLLSAFQWTTMIKYYIILLIIIFSKFIIRGIRLLLKSTLAFIKLLPVFYNKLLFITKKFIIILIKNIKRILPVILNSVQSFLFSAEKTTTHLTIICLTIILLPFLFLPYFTFPNPEDFTISAQIIENGIHYPELMYQGKDGRYFTNILYMISPLTWKSMLGLRVVTMIMILSFWGSLYYFLKTLLKSLLPQKQIIVWGLLIILLYTCNMPSLAAGYYWLFAIIPYIVPLILFFILTACIIKGTETKFKLMNVVGICLLIVMISGAHEMYLPLTSGYFFAFSLWGFYKRNSNRYYFFTFLIISILCAIFVISAPGNAGRMTVGNPGKQMLDLIQPDNLQKLSNYIARSVLDTFYRNLAENSLILLMSIITVPVFLRIVIRNYTIKNIVNIHPAWAFLGLLLLISMPIIPYFIVGENLYLYLDRMFNIVCIFFILGWFYFLFVSVNFLMKYKHIRSIGYCIGKSAWTILFTWVIIIFFIIKLFSSDNNIYYAYNDIITGKVTHYYEQLKMRYSNMERSLHNIYRDHSLLVIFPLTVRPASIHYLDYDIIGYGNSFRESAASYFNVNEVRYIYDTIPFNRPLLMKDYSKKGKDRFYEIYTAKGNPVFSSGLISSFASGLFDIDSAFTKCFIYKMYYYGYNMYDTSFNIDQQVWCKECSEGEKILSSAQFMNLRGDTTYASFTDTLLPRPGNPGTFEHYAKYQLSANNKIDRQFIAALLQNRIKFVVTTR